MNKQLSLLLMLTIFGDTCIFTSERHQPPRSSKIGTLTKICLGTAIGAYATYRFPHLINAKFGQMEKYTMRSLSQASDWMDLPTAKHELTTLYYDLKTRWEQLYERMKNVKNGLFNSSLHKSDNDATLFEQKKNDDGANK